MRYGSMVLASLTLLAVGCQTANPGIHMIPVTRDYAQVQKLSWKDASKPLGEAQRLGAASHAPYEYYSAMSYLGSASSFGHAGDREGAWDFAALGKEMAEAAVRLCPEPEEGAEPRAAADSYDACVANFEQVKASYSDLDKAKAIQTCAPQYAHVTAALSHAEHMLKMGKWQVADSMLVTLESDINTIQGQDSDQDGTPDLKDGAPLLPEDFDGFEDDNGAPDVDNDRDGVPDKNDIQPNESETHNGYKDEDGAPDQLPTLETVSFDPASLALTGEGKGYLRGVKQLLLEWPRLRLRVTGNAQAGGTESQAMDVSRARAEGVRAYLVEQGVPESQIVVTFLGGSEPNDQVDLRLE